MMILPGDGSTRVTARQSLACWNLELERGRPPIRYGFSVVCVAVALGVALACRHYGFRDAELPLFDLAIVVATWYAGIGPSVLAVALSTLSFEYFFAEPIYSLEITREDLPYFFVFIAFAAITAWLVGALRGAASNTSMAARSGSALAGGIGLVLVTFVCIRFGQDIHVAAFGYLIVIVALALTSEFIGSVGLCIVAAGCLTYFFVPSLLSFRLEEPEGSITIAAFLTISFFVNGLIIQRKRAEAKLLKAHEELAKRAKELESSNNELESFSYSVAHDLRAPLRHVVGFSELLQKQASSSLDEKSRRYSQTILESSKRMGDLIDDLLAFSRIGRAETKKTLVNLDQLVKELVTEIGQDTAGRDFIWRIDPLPVCYGDRTMLRLVIANLLSNVVKFTRIRAQAEIEIGCVEGEHEVEVFVKDNGAGFDMQYVDKLFGVFQRLHLPEQFEGTGIGLATVRRIIHRHGGEVRAEGGVDQGATFYFSLPKTPDARERIAL